MNIVKNIFGISYLKNKGVRRLLFVIGVCLSIYASYGVINGIYNARYEKTFRNLEELNYEMYFVKKYEMPKWYVIYDCASIYFKQYDVDYMDIYSLGYFENIYGKNFLYGWDASKRDMLISIKDEPIHLSCNGIESYSYGTAVGVLIRFVFIAFCFYAPFLLAIIIKLVFGVFVWVYKGFKMEN